MSKLAPSLSRVAPLEQAAKHAIVCDKPAVNFFEGALLGNGGLGAVVTTRPDAVLVHFGHNNVWDIRITENSPETVGTFREFLEKVKASSPDLASLDDQPWYREYRETVEAYYRKKLYPRPLPCGTLLLGFDRRRTELLGHRLDISTGLCEVHFLIDGERSKLQLCVDMTADRLWLRMVDQAGAPVASPFERVRLIPDPETPTDIPDFEIAVNPGRNRLAFRQLLPCQEPHLYDAGVGHPRDRAFRLTLQMSDDFDAAHRERSRLLKTEFLDSFLADRNEARREKAKYLEKYVLPASACVACVWLDEGLASEISVEPPELSEPTLEKFEAAALACRQSWEDYWGKSGIAIQDEFLEATWYRNLYFLNCAVRPGVNCPGLFANWRYGKLGTAWHGDYHMNYNTQQPFWVTFSSNHLDKHLPYVELVRRLLPLGRRWARDYYALPGACFPHVAFPVEMSTSPFRVPWGWQISETPWTVQSLWWHYRHSMDEEFLDQYAFEPIREVVLFLVSYLRRPEAHGQTWGDDRYHVFPTVCPELYGMTPGFKKNYDCLVDLTLIKFVFNAYLQACDVLGMGQADIDLVTRVRDVLGRLPEYPTAMSQRGMVFVSIPGEDPETVYSTPNTTTTVFPGEEHGLHSPAQVYDVAANSYHNQRVEGGNELVFYNLQGARLGLLDLERFKRQIRYCLLPNGTCTDMLLQVHGRYKDDTPFDFMAGMGIWFENFALPVVINECLLQSYYGELRFFPNWPADKRAEFRTLRAMGAFLVSAAFEGGQVQWIEILSEAGGRLRVILPWDNGARCIRSSGELMARDGILEIDTMVGERISMFPLQT